MTPLQQFLVDSGGVVTFEKFMRWALYEPQHGYYSRRVTNVGRTGDFATSATLSPALGQAITAWAKAHREEAISDNRWHLIEVGPGNGQLAAGILRSLRGWMHRRLTYHLVEISTPLAERQRETLRHAARGLLAPSLHWHTEIAHALQEADGHALIISNELVDAFPCVALELGPGADGFREVGLRWDDARQEPVEILLDPSADYSACVAALPQEARRIEIHSSWREWLEKWRKDWKRGRMLTIDYGDRAGTLYHRRPRGTLRGFFRQQRIDGPEIYERAGHQDLTADVNFSDLVRWGEELGLTAAPLQTQRDFILHWNPGVESTDAATAQILDPLGAGRAFKVLEQFV